MPGPALTRRERELYLLLAGGATRAQVLHVMGISKWTYMAHIRHVYAKLGVYCREDVYRELGWLQVPDA
jgi:DNA-binding CsgD family transcriptional regulator